MSSYPQNVPGLAPPLDQTPKGVTFAELIGAAGPNILWGRFLMLVLALILSELVWLVPEFLLHPSHVPAVFVARIWTHSFLGDFVMALAALLCFRWIRPAAGALALAAVAYAGAMIPVGLALTAIFALPSSTPGFSFTASGLPEAALRSFVGSLFFFGPMVFILPRMRPIWLGIGLGALVGSILSSSSQLAISIAQFGGRNFSGYGFVWSTLGTALISAVVFAGAFIGGLALVGFRPAEFPTESAFATGSAPTVGPAPAGFRPPDSAAEAAHGPGSGPSMVTGRAAEVQAAINFRALKLVLRGPGIGSLVFGLIAVVMGAVTLEDNSLNGILMILGIFLLAEGIWLLSSPSAAGMIVDGIALLSLGAWNILVTIGNMSAAGSQGGGFGFIGVLQIVWAFRSFGRYRRLKEQPLAGAGDPASKWLDATMNSAFSQNPGSDVIRFRVKQKKTFLEFRGKLLDDFGLFFDVKQRLIVVAYRDAARITVLGTPAPSGNNPAGFNFAGNTWEGDIDMQNWERFNQWKTSVH